MRAAWKAEEAVRLMLSIPEAAKPYAIASLELGTPGNQWASVLLARMNAPELVPILTKKVATETDASALADYFYALALMGTDEAYGILEHYAAQGTGSHRSAAQRVLKQHPRG